MTGAKRERAAKVLARVETACELLEVIVPRVVELVGDVREVLELDRKPAELGEPAVRRAS